MTRRYRPDIHDFFPKTRRGHGTTHPQPRIIHRLRVLPHQPVLVVEVATVTRNACVCVNAACSLLRRQTEDTEKRRGEAHVDPKANVEDWKAERRYPKDAPLENCR